MYNIYISCIIYIYIQYVSLTYIQFYHLLSQLNVAAQPLFGAPVLAVPQIQISLFSTLQIQVPRWRTASGHRWKPHDPMSQIFKEERGGWPWFLVFSKMTFWDDVHWFLGFPPGWLRKLGWFSRSGTVLGSCAQLFVEQVFFFHEPTSGKRGIYVHDL